MSEAGLWLLNQMMLKHIRNGSLTLYDTDGSRHDFGGRGPGPRVAMRLRDTGIQLRLALNPGLALGEGYMDGGLTFEEGSTVDDYVKLYAANRAELKQQPAQRVLQQLWRWTRHFQQRNTIAAGVRQARGHYASEELFQLFLDSGMHYSSAYWTDPTTETLEDAQRRKMRHFAAKLELKKGMRVLDIGSGWGAFSIYLSKHFDVEVTAANPAREQLAASRRRAEQAGVADRITFLEKDYRELDGSFDRIVSIEMLEHVGAGYLDTYFRKAR